MILCHILLWLSIYIKLVVADDAVDDNDDDDKNNNKDSNIYKGNSALGLDRDMGFSRGHQGR